MTKMDMEEVGVYYKGNSYAELVYLHKEEVQPLLEIVTNEAIEVFVMDGREFRKSELDSLSFDGISIQFYEE